jgi:N-acetylmuramoyl-L-alanine amidase
MKRNRIIFLIVFFAAIVFGGASGQGVADYQIIDKVVIDAGHGGFDYGAMGKLSKEKDITLAIALKTGKLIKESCNDVEVFYTRTDDTFVELHRRALIANENNADLFISIHCNSINSIQPTGAETYVMGLHKTQENLEVAKNENSAILMENNYHQQYDGFNPNLDEDYIVLNMVQSAGIAQSLDFSLLVQEKLHSVAGINNRGVKQAGFVVLYLTTMPGVLIETGFLSNPEEEIFLMDTINQDKIALAISEAFKDYKQTFELPTLSLLKFQATIDTIKPPAEPKITYRIRFASFKNFQPLDSKIFRGLDNLKVYYDNNEYHYTFGLAYTKTDIRLQLSKAKKMKSLKKRYLKNCKIVGFNEDNSLIYPP